MNTLAEINAASAPAAETQPMAARRHDTWSPGDIAHQGDLILVCLAGLPRSAKPRTNRQLAEGETRGSRHMLDGGELFDVDPVEVAEQIGRVTNGRVKVDPKYVGSVFTGASTIEHPQHQHQSFPDHPCTAVVYQRNLSSEEREQRAAD